MDVIAKFAKFVVDAKFEKFPPKALETAKIAVLDCLGVALAGSKEECAKISAEIARREEAKEEATIVGQKIKTSALHAAFANGTAAHALDFDHSFTLTGQPTAPIIPALISLGEAVGASGRKILEAYVTGFEVTGKLVYALRESTHDGWHAPNTLGIYGATAASAKLLGLDASQVEMALGITASMASGVSANFGTMTKPLHVGLGARNGVLAAKLAQSGYTANAKAIEAGAGFFDMYHNASPIRHEAIEELGQSYAAVSDGIRIKPYPCGGLTHQAIDAMLQFRAEHGITADMIESIAVDVTQHTYSRIVFKVPQTGIQGKFCMNYLLARAIIDGRVSLEMFTDAAVRDPNVLKLGKRVQMRLDTKLKASDAGGRPCRVTVRLKDGKTYIREVQHAKGGPEVPMSRHELRAKFTECARQAVSDSTAARLLEQIDDMESLPDIRPLCQLLRGEN